VGGGVVGLGRPAAAILVRRNLGCTLGTGADERGVGIAGIGRSATFRVRSPNPRRGTLGTGADERGVGIAGIG